ncbi:hypothetical protein [Rhizobium sp. RU36D]|uniref:hypothetical protein n=1 Tax=Rhizobium sp. RU36D TaxID=1907415 RepID=UPI001179E987|nr:hypothetical protein [Rhizobium sp. RU36D]
MHVGITRISVAAPWLEIPLGLQQKIDIVLSSDSKKRSRLSQGLTNVSSLIWLDINELQAAFQGRGCDFVKAGFRELDSQKRENLAAFTLQFQSSANIYGDIQKSLLSKHCPND